MKQSQVPPFHLLLSCRSLKQRNLALLNNGGGVLVSNGLMLNSTLNSLVKVIIRSTMVVHLENRRTFYKITDCDTHFLFTNMSPFLFLTRRRITLPWPVEVRPGMKTCFGQ